MPLVLLILFLVDVLTVAAGAGVGWALLEIVAARAWSARTWPPVLACSIAVATIVLVPALVLALATRTRRSFRAQLVLVESTILIAIALWLWGYLASSQPLWSRRTLLIAALAALAAVLPALGCAALVSRLAARTGPRVRGALRLSALVLVAWSAWWIATCRDQAAPERWRSIGESSEREPNVVLLIGDTIRSDHVSALGYERRTTPQLAELGGALFTRARSVATWTRPAVTTMLSGLPPASHGVVKVVSSLPDDLVPIAETFARSGFATGFLTANPNTSAIFGFDRGCDWFFDGESHPLARLLPTTLGQIAQRLVLRYDQAWILNGEVRRFLDLARERRFFLVVHYNDPHTPYAPPAPFDRLFAAAGPSPASHDPVHVPVTTEEEHRQAIALYDGEIASLDQAIGDLVLELRRRDLLRRTALVFAADHGEEFRDHGGYGHGRKLYEEVLRVPMLVRPAGDVQGGRRIDAVVSLLDVAPTLLDLGHVRARLELPGRSLLPLLDDHALAERAVVSTSEVQNQVAWCDGATKLILDGTTRAAQLFDLGRDPGEQHDLAASEPERVASLRARVQVEMDGWLARALAPRELELSADLTEQLRKLGYVR